MIRTSDLYIARLQATMSDDDWAEIDRRESSEDAAYWREWAEHDAEYVPDADAPDDDDIPL